MPFVRRHRSYYKDGIEVPSSSITDFGSYKYYKEVTTGGIELEYACYYSSGELGDEYYYAKAPIGNDLQVYGTRSKEVASSSSELGAAGTLVFSSLNEDTAVLGVTFNRYRDGDLYIDTTATEIVEVTAEDNYDFTEFVPSTQFDYYEDGHKLYTPVRRQRSYYKYGDTPAFINLANSDNTAWITTDGKFSFYYYNGTADDTHNLIRPVKATKLFIKATIGYQANAHGDFVVFAITESGTYEVVRRSCGYGESAEVEFTYEFDKIETITGIRIVNSSYAGTNQYCYGGVTASVYRNSPVETTVEDADYYEDKILNYAPTVQKTIYYKYGTEPNVTVVGAPVFQNNTEVKGIDADNYITTPESFTSKIKDSTWELVLKINNKENDDYGLFSTASDSLIKIYVSAFRKAKLSLSSNGTSFDICDSKVGSASLAKASDRWIKLSFDGSQYVLSVSSDGVTYTPDIVVNSTKQILNRDEATFIGRDSTSYGKAHIVYLAGSYIKINNKIWWRGTNMVDGTSTDHDYFEHETKLY